MLLRLRIERRMWSNCHFLPLDLHRFHPAFVVVVVNVLVVLLADAVIAVIFVDLVLPAVVAIVDHVLFVRVVFAADALDDVTNHPLHPPDDYRRHLPADPPQHPHSHPRNKHLNSSQTTFSHHTVHYLLLV